MPPARKPSLKFGQKPRDDLSANAATVECALPIRTASNGIFARPINRMDNDAVQAALATVCAYVQRERRDGVLVQLRKQRRATGGESASYGGQKENRAVPAGSCFLAYDE